jgi:hypothetical protein
VHLVGPIVLIYLFAFFITIVLSILSVYLSHLIHHPENTFTLHVRMLIYVEKCRFLNIMYASVLLRLHKHSLSQT